MAAKDEALIANLNTLADHLHEASRLLEGGWSFGGLWRDLPQDRADQLEKMLSGDYLATAKAVSAYAAAWQADLNAEEDL